MDTVTYPDPRVRGELELWIERKVDVTDARSVAEEFGVVAVPVAVAVTGEGLVLGRIRNFVKPETFRPELERLRLGRVEPAR